MCTKIKMFMIPCLLFLLVGCTNTMYFYETEKVAFTVEARPDSSQPVQGSIGVKQRVALVVPKKQDNGDGSGDALSAISSFNLKITEVEGFNPILIQTAFVTGEAASQFDGDDKKEAAAAVAEAITIEGAKIPGIDTYARCIFGRVKSDEDKRGKLRQIVDKDNFAELSMSEWEEQKPDLIYCGIRTRLHFTDTLRKELRKEMNK